MGERGGRLMALRPLKPCAAPACPALVRGQRYCGKHENLADQTKRDHDRRRGNSTQRGYGYKWQQARARFLQIHPLCVHCEKEGRVTAARDVDHVIPHRGDQELFWRQSNWQALCTSCHSKKTATEDSGFGNPRAQRGGGSNLHGNQ